MKNLIFILLLIIGCDGGTYYPTQSVIEEEEIIVNEGGTMIINVLTIEEYPFFWVTNGNSVQGFKDDRLEPVTIYAEQTEGGEKTTVPVNPKLFFIKNNAIYFSADFTEKNSEYDPDEENPKPETITVERYFEQVQGRQPIEIDELPAVPSADFYVGSDGRYRLEKNQYEDIFVSDIFKITTGTFNRHLKVSNYYYNKGAYIDVQDGLPGLRDAGLYFWSDTLPMVNKIADAGRMWRF
jgi:hypothetical protein